MRQSRFGNGLGYVCATKESATGAINPPNNKCYYLNPFPHLPRCPFLFYLFRCCFSRSFAFISFFLAYFYPAIERDVFSPRVREAKLFLVWVLSELRPLWRLYLIRGQIHLLFSLANKLRGTRTIYYCKPTPSITTNVYYELYLMVDICLRTHSTQLHSLAHNNYGIIN